MLSYQPDKIQRVMLKISGEILAGEKGYGFDEKVIDQITDDIIEIKKLEYQVGIVLGGGNIFRGGTWKNKALNRVVLDNIGMMATIQNALYLAEILNNKKHPAKVYSSLQMDKLAEFYIPSRVRKSLEKGKICFFCGGTGNPYFTTDTAAVLRAAELEMDIVLKGTKVDGLYSADPELDAQAQYIHTATYQECLQKKLGVMDMTAFSLAQENGIAIKIFNISKQGNMKEALLNSEIGTYIHP